MFELLQKKGSDGKTKKCNFNSKDAYEPKSLTALIDVTQSGSQSPSSFINPNSPSPKPSFGLNSITLKNVPCFENLTTKLNQAKLKSQKLCRAVNHQEKKLELLNEIYQTDEYTTFTTKNKLIQCTIDISTPYKILEHTLSLLDKSLLNYERTIHPAYSEDLYYEDQSQQILQNQYNVQYEIQQPINGIDPQNNETTAATYMQQSLPEDALLQQNNNQVLMQQNEQVQLLQDINQGHQDLFDSITSRQTLNNINNTVTTSHSDHINESAFVDQQLMMLPASALNTQDTSGNPDLINGVYNNLATDGNTNEQLVQLANEQDLDPDLFFVKEDGIYVRVDEHHFHRMSYISPDGSVVTETDLKIELPPGTNLPIITNINEQLPLVQEQEQQLLLQDQQSNQYISMDTNDYLNNSTYDSNNFQLIQDNNTDNNNNSNNSLTDFQLLTDLNTQTPSQFINSSNIPSIPQPSSVSSSMSRYSSSSSTPITNNSNNNNNGGGGHKLPEYVALPPRPIPLMPFALHSQLLTPELAISITDKDRELMLTFDNQKRNEPQQEPIFYQIYSCSTIPSAPPHNTNNNNNNHQAPQYHPIKPHNKSHRKSNYHSSFNQDDSLTSNNPNSQSDDTNKWSLLGEVQAYKLPMFCTINIPPIKNQEHTNNNNSYLRYYFSIRSVDEFQRYSDWSNVVQVELADNQ